MYILETDNVVKQYAGHRALDGVSISVKRGSIFGLLGPNGAGKTTLLRIINRITAPDSGSLLFNGRPMQAGDITNIGYLPEERGLYKKMKAGEHALYLAQLKGLSRKEALSRLKSYFDKMEIHDWWNRKIEELSKGMAQKIQFIVTVIHEPELLIFDEPFSGFDPVNTQLLKNEILALRDKGSTIVFSTHNMASVEELCDDIALLNKSQCVLKGNIGEIKRSYGANVYKIVFRGSIEDVDSLISGEHELLETSAEQHNITAIKVRSENGNKLLSAILPLVEIVEYSESMPTMNDIFISVVRSGMEETLTENSLIT
ncbi:MAG: ATP-binding cassette domain-containing protein [Prevotellaceae bacterium]|jgi:ABC-2 type transport system ATP-binding protein|nr:ATP-binding cassette domain-containing protein [Prevotellaceae bacterium]